MKKLITLLTILMCATTTAQQYIDANNTQVVGVVEDSISNPIDFLVLDAQNKFRKVSKDSIVKPSELSEVAFSGDSKDVFYNNTTSGIESENVQDAIDEVYSKIKLPFKLVETDKTSEQHWRDVVYGDGKYVAVAQDGDYRIKVSYDAENWLYVEAPLVSFQGITYGNGLFVAVCNDAGISDKIFVSEDAFNWRPVLNTIVTFRGINYYNGVFVAYSSGHSAYPIHRSENGLNWTTHNVPADYHRNTRGMVFFNGVWLGISDANYNASRPYNGIISYDNALTWESYMMPTYPNGDRLNWNKIISAQGKIVAVASGSRHKAGLFWTEDLETWIDASPDGENMLIESIAYGNGRFVIEGWSLSSLGIPGWGKVYETFDLENWNLIYTHPNRVASRSMTFGNGVFVSVYGTFSSGQFSTGNVTSYYGKQERLSVSNINNWFGSQKLNGDVFVDNIKSPTGQEYNITVDDTGKLNSEPKPTIPEQVNLIEGSNITITGDYPNLTLSASGTVGTNWDDIGGDQSDINLSGFTNDSGFTTNTGTVTSVGLQVPEGFEVSNSPITSSGTLEIDYAAGYQSYTTEEADKLASIESGAEVNVNADWNASSGDAEILNKPALGTMATESTNDYYTKTQVNDTLSYYPLYEEGTWSGNFVTSETGTTPTGTQNYIKVGNQVTIYVNWTGDLSGLVGIISVDGLPTFGGTIPNGSSTIVVHNAGISYPTDATSLIVRTNGGDALFRFNVDDGNYVNMTDVNITGTAHSVSFTLTYRIEP